MVRYIPWKVLWRVMLGAVLAAPLLRILAIHTLSAGKLAAYVLMPCRADALCMGVLIAMATRSALAWQMIMAYRRYLYMAFALASCGGLWMVLGRFEPGSMFGLEYSLLALIYSLLLISALVSPRLSSLFSFSPLRSMGTFACGLYLFHSFLALAFRVVLMHLYPASGWVLRLAVLMLAYAVCVGLGAISWEYFEKPLVRLGHCYSYNSVSGALDAQNV